MGIFVKPMDRIRKLERENARLRALVGEATPAEPVDMGEEQQPAPTLIEKTDTLEEAVTLIAEVIING